MNVQTLGNNASLAERAQYGEIFSADKIVELFEELDAWRRLYTSCNNSGWIETPEEMEKYLTELEELAGQCNNEDHAQFDDYKQFFDDAVDAMCEHSGRWPGAAPWDQNLTAAILECIAKGAESIEAEREEANK